MRETRAPGQSGQPQQLLIRGYSGTPQSRHSEIRTPRYRGQFLQSQILHLCTFQPQKSGHPDNLDTFLGPQGVRIRGAPLYLLLLTLFWFEIPGILISEDVDCSLLCARQTLSAGVSGCGPEVRVVETGVATVAEEGGTEGGWRGRDYRHAFTQRMEHFKTLFIH